MAGKPLRRWAYAKSIRGSSHDFKRSVVEQVMEAALGFDLTQDQIDDIVRKLTANGFLISELK